MSDNMRGKKGCRAFREEVTLLKINFLHRKEKGFQDQERRQIRRKS